MDPDGMHLLTFYLRLHTDHAQIGIVALPSGEFHPLTNDVNSYSQLALSGDGRTLSTVLTNIDSSIAYYKAEGGTPLSTTPLRITLRYIAWANEDRLLFILPSIAIGSIDRATGNVQNFDTGEVDVGSYLSACADGHILFTGFPKGAPEARVLRMDADGGNIVQLTNSGIARAPHCSGDGKQVYYSVAASGADNNASLSAVPLAGGTPRQVLPPETTISFRESEDGKLADIGVTVGSGGRWKSFDVASGRMAFDVPTDLSESGANSSPARFSPDDQAVVKSVLRSGGATLLYQPLDGSAPHTMIDPVPELIYDFGWSPSGKQMAVLRMKSSSDVVLIQDREGK